jgi:hypothetical protein
MSDPFPVFLPDGTMAGNLTSSQGVVPVNLPGATILNAPESGAITYPTINSAPTPQAASTAATPYSGANLGPLQGNPSTVTGSSSGTGNPITNAITGMLGGAQNAGTGLAGALGLPDPTKLLTTAMVFILGAVFIAAGLYLMGKDVLPNPAKLLR